MKVSRVEGASINLFSAEPSYHNIELMVMICPLVPCGKTVGVGANHFLILFERYSTT